MQKMLAFALLFVIAISASSQTNWSHFRGNMLNGHAQTNNCVVEFGEMKNLAWKTPVEGLGYSSPLIWENQVWLTTATRSGDKMWAVCLDLQSGKVIRQILLFEPKNIQNIHSTNSYATSTGCIENGFVYLHFGTYGTACINTANFELVWRRTDMNCEHMQGAASSLLLYKNMLMVHIEGTDVQYIAALDKTTGQTIWKTERPQEFYRDIAPVYRKAYTTPLIVNVNGRDQLISNGAQMCIAYDPENGSEIWQVWYGYDSTVGMPLAYNGLVYFNSGWIFLENIPNFVKFFAVDPTGKGDVTKTHVKWELTEDVSQISTPVIVDGRIYMVHERGEITCLDAISGKILWKEKLKGQFNASPVYAGGHIYFSELHGTVYVIKPGERFELVAKNKLDGIIKATPAFTGDNIIMRTDSFIYRLGMR